MFTFFTEEERRQFLFHPYRVALIILLFSISMLFGAFMVSYLYLRFVGKLTVTPVPWIFYATTLILILATQALRKSQIHFNESNTILHAKYLKACLWLSIAFLLGQCLGWWMMIHKMQLMTSGPLSGFIYVMSATHLMHVIAGIPFLIFFIVKYQTWQRNHSGLLLYFLDAKRKFYLHLLDIYWRYLDVLWIVLMFFLIMNQVLG